MSDVAQALCHEEQQTDTAERRLCVRYASDLPALCQKTDAEVHDIWLRGKIRDLSVSGLRLLLNRPFMTNALIIIEPSQIKNVPPRVIKARVIYTKRHDRGWVMGCEFTQELTQDELRSLMEGE